jgi:hypothetical protein
MRSMKVDCVHSPNIALKRDFQQTTDSLSSEPAKSGIAAASRNEPNDVDVYVGSTVHTDQYALDRCP